MAAKPPEFSDAVRLALLYRFGGSWLDVDDLAVRSFSSNPNMLCAMSWPGKRTVEYFGLSFELARGELLSSHYRDSGIHIQNDPMLNWEPGNSFLKRWMTELLTAPPVDWGQKVPTSILLHNPDFVVKMNVKIVPQHFFLLHPAYALNGGKQKGKMFPPHDFRLENNFPEFDTFLSEDEFHKTLAATQLEIEMADMVTYQTSAPHLFVWIYLGLAAHELC